MLTRTSFRPLGLHISAFAGDEEFVPHRMLRRVLGRWADVYDGNQIALPVSDAIPREAPLVQWVTKDETERLDVSRTRINLVQVVRDDRPLNPEDAARYLTERLVAILEADETPVGRLAAVLQSVAEPTSPAAEVARHFFKERWLEGPLNRPKELEVHAHKVFRLREDLDVNSWVRVRTAELIDTKIPVVSLEQDINTLEEARRHRQFLPGEVKEFFDSAVKEFVTIQELYFPSASPATEE
jgi:hypothetical protein